MFLSNLMIRILTIRGRRRPISTIRITNRLHHFRTNRHLTTTYNVPRMSTHLKHTRFLQVMFTSRGTIRSTFNNHSLMQTRRRRIVLNNRRTVSHRSVRRYVPNRRNPNRAHRINSSVITSINPPTNRFRTIKTLLQTTYYKATFRFVSILRTHNITMMLNMHTIQSSRSLNVLVRSQSNPRTITLMAISLIRHLLSHRTPSL